MDVLTLTGDGQGKVEILVQFITCPLVNELATVNSKSRRPDIVIPRGQSVIVSCRATAGPVTKIPVLFELDPNPSWQNCQKL